MSRFLTLSYGLLGYIVFLATFLYLIAFVTGLPVPYTVDAGGPESALRTAILVDVGLIALFGIQHSIMARPGFKRRWTRIVPKPIERTTFMMITCAIFALMFTQWRPIPTVVWDVDGFAGAVLDAIGWTGWLIALVSTFLIDHFDLFGLRQTWLHFRGRTYTRRAFQLRSLYRMVRHPLMLGFVIAFFGASTMTVGHLLFAGTYLAYILIALVLEERDLVAEHGDAYEDYRRRVPKLIPGLPRASGEAAALEAR
jgi:protein-S-isoprenylcysteine O-methyltransferase Ste14